MTDFLTHLGALSLGGAAVILLLIASSLFTRSRYAARWRCWAWLLLCLRLAVPFPLPSLQSEAIPAPIQLPAPSDQVIYTPAPVPSPPTAANSSPEPPAQSPNPTLPVQPEQNQPVQRTAFTLSQLLFVLWAAVAAVILLWNLWGHLRFSFYLHRWSTPVEDKETLELFWQLGEQLHLRRLPRLVTCQGLSVPMLAGVFRPTLLLPQQPLLNDQLRYSLLHELTHYRRRDILFKSLGLWVTALHWFNPAVWLMSRYIERDTELSCDDAALRQLPVEEHAAYGRTILAAVEHLKEARA